jgi:hypothetical protein
LNFELGEAVCQFLQKGVLAPGQKKALPISMNLQGEELKKVMAEPFSS